MWIGMFLASFSKHPFHFPWGRQKLEADLLQENSLASSGFERGEVSEIPVWWEDQRPPEVPQRHAPAMPGCG